MTEDGRKHLEFVEQVINRMSGISFQAKGLSVTLVAGLFALSAAESKREFAWLALVPIFAFWMLDAYYLTLERVYRKVYDWLRVKTDAEVAAMNFSMNPTEFGIPKESMFRAALTKHVLLFHLLLLLAVLAFALAPLIYGAVDAT